MKQFLIDIMATAMPHMHWLLYVGAAALALAVIGILLRLVAGSGGGLVRLGTLVLILVGLIFAACEGVGAMLGMEPQINFEFLTGEKFDLRPFWQVGVAMLVPGFILRLFAGSSKDSAAQ